MSQSRLFLGRGRDLISQHRDSMEVAQADGEVKATVAVEIRDPQPCGFDVGAIEKGKMDGGPECSVAISQEYADRVAEAIGHGQMPFADAGIVEGCLGRHGRVHGQAAEPDSEFRFFRAGQGTTINERCWLREKQNPLAKAPRRKWKKAKGAMWRSAVGCF
jgi:hypothetical protein